MSETEFVISNINILEGAIEVTFMRYPDDVRNDGQLVATRSFTVADNHPSYAEEIAEFRELIVDLVSDIYNDFDSAPVIVPEEPVEDDDDEEEGMGE